MQIKNEYVKIQNGKTYDFRNTITNDYLELFNKSQYDDDYKLLSKSEKELKYCYIKTEEELSQGFNYYNLLDVQDISSSSQYFSISDYWVNYSNLSASTDNITFNNTGYLENGYDYKLLFAVKNLNGECEIVIDSEKNIKMQYIYEQGSLKFKAFSGTLIDGEQNIKTISPISNVYYVAIHLHDVADVSKLLSIDLSFERSTTVSFQYSIIKETNNGNFVEAITNYEYSPYLDLTDLAGQYNYRLPVVEEMIDGQNNVEIYYTYNNASGYSKSDGLSFNDIVDINDIAGKTIQQLAFGNNSTIYAFVDVSACNITMQENEALYVYRKDNFNSDASYVGNYYPAHLSPLGINIDDYTYYGSLYSVGFGFSKGNIHEEYLISENPVTEIDDYTFQIELERGTNNTLTPNDNLYPNSNLYPVLEVHTTGIYPNNNLYPNADVYPQLTDYKYIIYKYNLYRIENNNIIYLNEFYTMSYYTEKKGMIRANTKLERS